MFSFVLFWVFVGYGHAEVCDVSTMGAVGDGKTLNTKVLQQAFNNASCTEVLVPMTEVFLTGPLNITRRNFILRIEGNLTFSDDVAQFPVMPHLPSYPCDRDICSPSRYQPCLLLFKSSNVTITGSGALDGNGVSWWASFLAKTLKYGRPHLFQTMYCEDIKIFNVSLVNSPFWTTHIWATDRVEIAYITVKAPAFAPNTDGIDPDSASNVWIHDVVLEEGDDCVAVKSGKDESGILFNRPTYNVLIERVVCSGHAMAIGSEMSGGVYNVTIRDVHIKAAFLNAVSIKTARSRGGSHLLCFLVKLK